MRSGAWRCKTTRCASAGCWPWPCYGPDPNSVANTSVEFALQGNHLTPGRKLSSIRLCVQCGQARHHEVKSGRL